MERRSECSRIVLSASSEISVLDSFAGAGTTNAQRYFIYEACGLIWILSTRKKIISNR